MPPTTTTTTVAPPPVSVPRTLPLVSVMAQGATGDGITDDTAAFQAALDNAGLATVGRIDVPPGTYLVGPLTVPAGVLLVGAGPGSVLRRATGTSAALLSTSGTHVTLQSLHLDGGGIQVLAAATRVRIVDCEITGASDPAVISAGTGVIIAGNVLSGAGTDAIAVSGPQTSVMGNRIRGSGSAGIRVTGNGSANNATTVIGNDVTIPAGHGPAGIVVDGATGVTVSDNRVAGSTSTSGGLGIGIVSDSAPVSNITVSGNDVSAIGADGVVVQQAQQVSLTGNAVAGCLGRGIVVGASSGVVVDANSVSGCGVTGIDASGTTDLVVTGNVCTQNTSAGITLGGPNGTTHTVVADNVCSGQAKGISASGVLDGVVLAGNQLGGNSTTGLSLVGATLSGGTTSLPLRRIHSVTVGSNATAVAHGLPYVPLSVAITPTSAGSVWQAAASDATNVYLQASASGVGCELIVG
jgi:hypothetical protein